MLTKEEHFRIMHKPLILMMREALIPSPNKFSGETALYYGATPMTEKYEYHYSVDAVKCFRNQLIDIFKELPLKERVRDGKQTQFVTFDDLIAGTRFPPDAQRLEIHIADNFINMSDLTKVAERSSENNNDGYGVYGIPGLYGVAELLAPMEPAQRGGWSS